MIIHSIILENFGIYGGSHQFDLTPQASKRFNRPIILFRGKNGVGKSTILEAIRLCLNGRLSLGTRTKKRDYETYLKRRLHRSSTGETAEIASVQLEFEHTILGRPQQYRVNRSWDQAGQQSLQIWLNQQYMSEDDEEKEYLLRELVPAGVAELFFFDGEKIATLSEAGEARDALLADTVKNLLGLHLVEQLDQDLEIYLTRQTGIRELTRYKDELNQLREDENHYQDAKTSVQEQLADCRKQLLKKQGEITQLEEKIAHQGGQYGEKQASFETKEQQIAHEIALVEQEIHELSRHLLPFAIAPKLLHSVQQRLLKEADYERWQASQTILKEIQERITQEASQPHYWEGITPQPSEVGQKKHIQTINRLLEPYQETPLPESEVIHRVSAEKRGVLLNWIDEALQEAPQQLLQLMQKRQALQQKQAYIQQGLSRVPLDQILRPLRKQRWQLEREYGRLEGEQMRLEMEEKRLQFHIDRIDGSKRRVTEQIASIDTDEDRIQLAARTKLLLATYQKRLTQHKLDHLATILVKRFNQLSRKRNFIERVTIDPESFHISLYRSGKQFTRLQLSAGEEQIFAIATLWALREVSGRPLPVIIDTPLSRLDNEHRQTMLAEFMPQVAQQVIVLATTSEIDEKTHNFLQPALSRTYLLSEQTDTASTQATLQTHAQQLVLLEEIQLDVSQ